MCAHADDGHCNPILCPLACLVARSSRVTRRRTAALQPRAADRAHPAHSEQETAPITPATRSPRCCGPVGRRWFPESWGSPRPAALPGMREVLSPSRIGGLYRGARFLFRTVGPFRTGDRASESAVCGGWQHSRMEVGWLAERPDSGARDGFTMQHARTTQMRMREARSRVLHVTSRQDSMYIVQHVSTVHRSPTINPQLTSNAPSLYARSLS